MWILKENVVFEMVDSDNNQLLGYGLESNSTPEERLQGAKQRLQRWLLFMPSTDVFRTHENLKLKPTSNPVWREKTTANSFIRMANDTFVAQRDMYAVVNIVLTKPSEIGDVMGQVSPYPRTPPGDHQMDFRTAQIVRLTLDAAENVLDRKVAGFVNAKGRSDVVSDESWVLLDAYPPSSATAITEYRIEALRDIGTVDFVNLVTGALWTAQGAPSLVFGKSAYFTATGTETPGLQHGG